MALTDKKYEDFYRTTGSDGDKISSKNLDMIEKTFEFSAAHGFHDVIDDPFLGPLVYMIQQMQDELDYLRTEISANKDKATFPGFGTSSTTALAGDTTTISTAQANEITASTKLGLRLQASRQASLTKSTTIEFGEFTTTVSGKTTTYSLPIKVVETDTSGKSPVYTTKTGSITLT